MTGTVDAFIENGVEYRRCPDGLHAVRASNREMKACRIAPGTSVVEANAFMDLPNLEEVELPDGLTALSRSAFLGCKRLVRAHVPESLRAIGCSAFFGTALESIYIPANCTFIGSHALVSNGRGSDIVERDQQAAAALREVRISPGNERFFVESGVLCERIPAAPDAGTAPDEYARAAYDTNTFTTESGIQLGVPSVPESEMLPADRQSAPQIAAVLWVGPETRVVLPHGTTTICQFAFAGLDEIDSLAAPSTLRWVQPLGLSFLRAPNELVVNVEEGGRPQKMILHPPQDGTGEHAILHSFSTSIFDARVLARNCDNATMWAGDTFQHAQEAVGRLHDPVLLEPSFRARFESYAKDNRRQIYRQFALHDYYRGFDQLRELGLLGRKELDDAIGASSDAGCVATTSYLLQLKNGGAVKAALVPGTTAGSTVSQASASRPSESTHIEGASAGGAANGSSGTTAAGTPSAPAFDLSV